MKLLKNPVALLLFIFVVVPLSIMTISDLTRDPVDFYGEIIEDKEFYIIDSYDSGLAEEHFHFLHFKTTPELMDKFILGEKLKEANSKYVKKNEDLIKWLLPPKTIIYHKNVLDVAQPIIQELYHNQEKTEGFFFSSYLFRRYEK